MATRRKARASLCSCLCLFLATASAISQASPITNYRAGAAAHAAGEVTRAIELYKAALVANPNYLEPTVGLADAFFELEEYVEALTHIKRARELSHDLELATREARIQVGVGDYRSARLLFDQVLAEQPNNSDVRLGMAEVDLAEGRVRQATARFEEALALAPRNRRALLSLVMIYQTRDDDATADVFLQRALRFHSGDPEVQLIAGQTRMRAGHLGQAITHLQTALALSDGNYLRARLALAAAFLDDANPDAATDLLVAAPAGEAIDPAYHYLRALALERSGDIEAAATSYQQSLRLSPGDEVVRLAFESLVIAETEHAHPQRAALASYRLERGKQSEVRNFLAAARIEYRRAVLLDPEGRDSQLAFASILQLRGFPLSYLNRLRALEGRFPDDEISDAIELLSGRAEDALGPAWDVDQFAQDRQRICVAVFYRQPAVWTHLDAGVPLTELLISELQASNAVLVPGLPSRIPSAAACASAELAPPYRRSSEATFEAAFSAARQSGSTYFVLLDFEESERTFTTVARVFLSGTGAELASHRAFRSGNDRVRDAIAEIANAIRTQMPWQFELLRRRFGTGLINGGRLQGVEPEQRLLIVKRGTVGFERERIALSVAADDVLGEFVVEQVDEAIATGRLERGRFFDFINERDAVIFSPPPRPEEAVESGAAPTGLLQRLLGNLLRIGDR